MKDISAQFDKEINGIIANIIGDIDFNDIDLFKNALLTVVNNNFPFSRFTLLLNVNGYLPINPSVHSYYNSFLKTTRILTDNCKAVAHVHHSQDHINDFLPYMDNFQGFFTDFDKAYLWLKERR